MPMTKVEEYLASAVGDSTLLLAHFGFVDRQIRLRVWSPAKGDQTLAEMVQARFAHAVVESIEEDETERESWPLDIIGFDCYEADEQWRFVLNCGTAEWTWVSEWPSL